MNQERILKEEDFKKRYRYDAQSPYKSGKQGVIYRAHDFQEGMQVRAIKKAQVDPAPNKERYSVLAEYQRVKRFENAQHPNVLRYYRCERFPTEMGYYDHCVMEFIINGQTLKDIPLNQRIPLAHPLLKGVLEGLQHVHSHGLIHRDIKPDNILVEHYNNLWVPKLADFGISIDINEVHLREDFMVGTPPYMALEQLESRTDHRLRTNCDLWAFGVLIYWYFTNQIPWVWGSNITELEARNQIIEQIKTGGYFEKLKVIPQPFQQIAQRCLIAAPQQRAQSAIELIALIGSSSPYSGDMETIITYDPKPEVVVTPDPKPIIPIPPVTPPPAPNPIDKKKETTEKKPIAIPPMLLVVFGAIASAALVVYLLFLSQQVKIEPFPTKICNKDNFVDCITKKISNIVAPVVQENEKDVVLNISWKVSKEGTVNIDIDRSTNLDDGLVDQIEKAFNDLGWQPATSKLGLKMEQSMSPLELIFEYNPSN